MGDGEPCFRFPHPARRVMAAHLARASRTCLVTGKERSAVPIVHPAALARICVRPPRWRLVKMDAVTHPPPFDSASRRHGGRMERPGCVRDVSTNHLTNQPIHRCRHGSGGAGETRGHGVLADHHARDHRRNGAAMTCDSICHAAPATASLSLLSGAGRRDPWRRRWLGWEDKETPPWCWHTARAKTSGGQT